MNQVFTRLGVRNWLFYVTLMCFLLGALLAANLNTQGSIRKELGVGEGVRNVPSLLAALKEQQATNDNLKKDIAALRQLNTNYEDELANRGKATTSLNQELQDLKFQVGLTPVQGPGIIITLDDNRSKKIGDPDADMYIVHDFDLRNVVNELYAAGAEAIAINDHRIVGRTAIRCVGPTTLINGEATAAPFKIQAVGNPPDLDGGLNIPNGILDLLRIGLQVKVERSQNIKIPAFTGATSFRYAKPLPLEAAKD